MEEAFLGEANVGELSQAAFGLVSEMGQRARSRTNSGVRLDSYQRTIYQTLLVYQDPVSGLFPGRVGGNETWIRDNIYSVLAVWGLALAYKKHSDLDEDRAKAYELQQRVVKSMRGLLICMMKQADKVERFKTTQSGNDCLHAKFHIRSMCQVVGDHEYGHLQMDAVSLFVLILAQMTASGLLIVFSLDEVAFVQNLVWYIETAYRIPDYGVWERGDKSNQGVPELNASSVGMAKAALEAINDLDLFGAHGGPSSVIHSIPDEMEKCNAVLLSMLPRESISKEIDAALLSIIGYPAFAVDNACLIDETRDELINKLGGTYGLIRFLRDGYNTPLEDRVRNYYETWELATFEKVECEWPVFFCYLLLDALFRDEKDLIDYYWEKIHSVAVTRDDGLIYIPEMYAVPAECVEAEKANPHSQTRTPIGRVPFLWGQSMYILCSLIKEGYLQAGEIDPLCRRNANYSAGRPPIVLQVAIVAEDEYVQQKLLTNGIEVDTIDDMSPIEVYPSSVLSYIYSQMGQSSKFQLTGRPSSEVGILSTSTIYQLNDRTMVFTPQTIDPTQSYWVLDVNLLSDLFRQNVAYLSQNWNLLGRPTMVLCISQDYFDDSGILHHALASLYRKLIAGYTMGTRVILGKLSEFLTTSCIYKLHYYQAQSGTLDVDKLMKEARGPQLCARPLMPTKRTDHEKRKRRLSNNAKERAGLHRSFIQRTRSIQVDASHMGKIDIRQRAEMRQDGNKAEEGGVSSSPLRRVPEGSMLLKRGSDFTPNEEAFSKTLNISCDELVGLLKETESLTEQAEIIHYLYVKKGSGWNTGLKLDDGDERGVALSVLIRELYDKAGHLKKWWLVRHAAGMLNRKGEDLAKAVSDILVRQKQITVGMANEAEKTISRPLPPMELVALIRDAYGEDSSTAMLTHEILMYLSMLIITEPDLFRDLLVLRIGLIIQVMATELARALKSDGDEAINVLLNLSPFEMKLMLHHILSGKELAVREEREGGAATAAAAELSPSLKRDAVVANLIHVNSIGTKAARSGISKLQKSLDHRLHKKSSLEGVPLPSTGLPIADDHVQNDTNSAQQREIERNGRWLRRRRLDGSLNRIPAQFYSKVWQVLARCKGIVIAECLISTDVTQEMTAKELKFALLLENALNRVPYPEYRQLLVEALMVLILMVDTEPTVRFHSQVRVDEIVRRGYKMFLEDQKRDGGEAIHCCAADPEAMWSGAGWNASASVCGGSAGICLHFYDSAPSGRYGSLTYMCRAVALIGDISVNVENDEDRKDMKRPAFDCNTQ